MGRGRNRVLSDIDIRFDGLILLLALAVGAGVYCLTKMTALAVAIARPGARARKVTAIAAAMCAASCAIAGPLFVYWDRHGLAAWADQLTYPWVLVFAVGCWFLARIR